MLVKLHGYGSIREGTRRNIVALLNIRPRNILTGAAVTLAVIGAVAIGSNPREFARAHGAVVRLSIATGATGGVYYPTAAPWQKSSASRCGCRRPPR